MGEYEDLIDRAETAPDSTGVIPVYTTEPQPTIAEPVTAVGQPGSIGDLSDIQS